MGKRHLTPNEIINQCKIVSREKRMADRTPWTVMSIICPYTLLKSEGYKGQRIAKIVAKIEEYEALWADNKVDLEELKKKVYEKAGGDAEAFAYTTYTENDISAKKGSYDFWLDSRQIEAQNAMNAQASRYLVFFFNALIDMEKFGKSRLVRVEEYLNSLMEEYQLNKVTLTTWRMGLYDEAGIVVEMPIDPLTQTKGSTMTGV